jgi:hypothetical protein
MTAPLEHRATLSHPRVMAAALAARSRTVPVYWLSAALFAGLVAAVWLGHLVTFWGVQQLPFEWMFAVGAYLPTLIPALLAYLVVALVASVQNGAMRRAYLANFTRLGIPKELEVRFEILPEGLRASTERITIFPRWEAVDTVERGEDGWVLSADHLTFLLPHDSFADEAAARVFVAAIVERLSESARGRSADAVAFARGDAAEAPEPPAVAAPEPTGPLTARARITRQEASWAGRVGYGRMAHPDRHAFFYPALAALVGGLLGLVASGLVLMLAPLSVTLANVMVFAGITFLLPLIGSAAGLWLGYRALGRIFEKAYHAALAARGSPDEADCEWEIAEGGLITRSVRGTSTTSWEAISELFRADAYWIVLSDLGVNVVPRRAFADEVAERTFVAALVGKLSSPARDRSGEAAAFAAG